MDFEKIPCAAWLEQAVAFLVQTNPETIAIASIGKDGNAFTAYYECDSRDMDILASEIHKDAILEAIKLNKDSILGEE